MGEAAGNSLHLQRRARQHQPGLGRLSCHAAPAPRVLPPGWEPAWKHDIPSGIGFCGTAEPRVTREGFVPAPPARLPGDTGHRRGGASGGAGMLERASPGCGDGEPVPDLPQPQPGLELQHSSAEPFLTFTDFSSTLQPWSASDLPNAPHLLLLLGSSSTLTRRRLSLQLPDRPGGIPVFPAGLEGRSSWHDRGMVLLPQGWGQEPAKTLSHQHTGHCAEPFLDRGCNFPLL